MNMGDLPQPEQNVLSQMVWSPLERASAASAAAAAAASASASAAGSSSSTAAGPAARVDDDNGPLTMSPLPQPRAHQQHLPQPPAAASVAAHYSQNSTVPQSGNDSKGHNQKQTNGKRLEDADVKLEAEKERELKRPKLEPAV